jgi:hypothetical protein
MSPRHFATSAVRKSLSSRKAPMCSGVRLNTPRPHSVGPFISNVARRVPPGMKNAPAYTGTRGMRELYAGASVVGGDHDN